MKTVFVRADCVSGQKQREVYDKMKWIQIKVHCRPAELDSICAVMSVLDAQLQIEDASDVVEANPVYGELIDETLLARRDEASVSIYCENAEEAEKGRAFLEKRFAEDGLHPEIALISLDEQDWENNWKQYYHPVDIGERVVIVPEWEEYDNPDGKVIVWMDPGMAFGSGTHETTRLCAAMLERYMPAGSTVLDVGTGSGILAITASKLGAAHVDAYDIDPMAVKVARENMEKNGCRNITCDVSDLLSAVRGVYDFVVANITADIIERMAPSLGPYVKRGGLAALSGIIDSRAEDVREAMTRFGFELLAQSRENDWVGMLFKKI